MFSSIKAPGNLNAERAAGEPVTSSGRPGPAAAPRPGGALEGLPGRPVGPSIAKRQFLGTDHHPSIDDGRELTWQELGLLARHYERKVQARIHLCGDSDPGILATAQRQWFDARKAELDLLEASPDKEFGLLQRYWDEAKWQSPANMATTFGPGAICRDDAHAAMRAHLQSCPRLIAWLQGKLQQERDALPGRAQALGPSAAQARSEIEGLAKDGTQGHRGFLFAAHRDLRRGGGHVDTYVITSRGESIQVIPHESMGGGPEPANLFTADPWHFMVPGKDTGPQADGLACATLGLSYLKEYLKDDAHQLNHRTMMVVHRPAGSDPAAPPVRFHLPSPQVLRYSQSAFYAKLMVAMVACRDEHAEVLHKGRSFKVLTLRGVLRAGGEVRRPQDAQAMTEGALDAFAGPWVEAFHQSMRKRDTMTIGSTKAGHPEANLYLTYATHRLGGKADQAEEVAQGSPRRTWP